MMDEILIELEKLGSFAAWGWSHAPSGDYGVISMDGQTELKAGDRQGEKIPEGTIDWFTRNPSGGVPAEVEAVLDQFGAAWYLNSIQYESDTGLLHYAWVWQYG